MLKFLLILLLIILVVRFFSRMMFSSYVYTNQKNQREPQQSRKEGSVTVEKPSASDKRIRKDEGEYVDYEEVK